MSENVQTLQANHKLYHVIDAQLDRRKSPSKNSETSFRETHDTPTRIGYNNDLQSYQTR